jgi:hypothetical protein
MEQHGEPDNNQPFNLNAEGLTSLDKKGFLKNI